MYYMHPLYSCANCSVHGTYVAKQLPSCDLHTKVISAFWLTLSQKEPECMVRLHLHCFALSGSDSGKQDYDMDMLNEANMSNTSPGFPANISPPSLAPTDIIGRFSAHPRLLRIERRASGSTTPVLDEYSPSAIPPNLIYPCDSLSNYGEPHSHLGTPDPSQASNPSRF